MFACEQITLAILAGGRGSRMGKPKSRLRLGGQPILEYLLRRLNWPGPKVLVTAPGFEHPPGSDAFDQEVIDPDEGTGPLRGILTALERLQTPQLIVATVDMPDITPNLFYPLLKHLDENASLVGVMYRRTHEAESIIEPFPLALRRKALDPVRSRFQSNIRSVHRLLDLSDFTTLPAPGIPNAWTNLNTPSDLARWTAPT